MDEPVIVTNGFYRLVKLEEDQNPVFPSHETVVEVRDDDVINLSTRRSCKLRALRPTRALFGPLETPYDITPVEQLPQVFPAVIPEFQAAVGEQMEK